jgi:branched-subunit amino acid transport protein
MYKMNYATFIPYLIVMAGVTYLVRVIPFLLVNKKIENRFINSFLYYIPYTVLAAMTFPAILYATGSLVSAAVGLLTAIVIAYRWRSLIVVASGACLAVFVVEVIGAAVGAM